MPLPAERLRVLVVDDEAPARQRLVDLLRKDPRVESILEAANGKAAVEIIGREALDLVFLDVRMPELDGLQVIENVGAAAMPLTVFVTAYDKHAIRAFEANALDYLLKPFSDERWEAALARAKARHDERGLREFGRNALRLLAARSGGRPLSRSPGSERRWNHSLHSGGRHRLDRGRGSLCESARRR